MFERRLKIVLILLAFVGIFVLGRAGQVQIVQREEWRKKAAEAMKLTHLVETTRGPIYDRNGKLLAVDKPCIDACVDYRALTTPPDANWAKQRALDRLKNRLGDQWMKLSGKQRVAMRDAEIAAVNSDIDHMWARLAQISGRSLDDIEETRSDIVRRVDMRQRYIWHKRYEEAISKGGKNAETGSWKKWLTDGGDDAAPIDSYQVVVAEQLEPHVILPAIDSDVQNELDKDIDQFPGLVLRPGTHRTYPYDDVACHLLGHLAHVDAKDLEENKGLDELRAYLRNDLIGKTGIEALCEPALRGTRGKIDSVQNEATILSSRDGVPGQPVRLTIDVELQQQIQAVFAAARLRDSNGTVTEENAVLHGAAVVLDVDTNQVLALVSYPTYNLNNFDELYPELRDDEINDPLRNRATMSMLEPGSTMKPFCGLAGIACGVLKINQGIECTGVLRLDGKTMPYGARCWVESMYGDYLRERGMSSAHHPIPFPHKGHDGNPDGWLTYSDALERSCNCFFETVADWIGIDRLSVWYDKFGFGRPTGIGIGEVKGRLPRDLPKGLNFRRRITGFLAGIGQGYVAVTPIQMANGAAMIARNGIWMRPVLVLPNENGQNPAMRSGVWQTLPDRLDLHLPADALAAAHLGMFNVVNGRAGTGTSLVAGDMMLKRLGICGKTGTAQAAWFSIAQRDANGKILYDDTHHVVRHFIEPSFPGKPNPDAPWYRAQVTKKKVKDATGMIVEIEKKSVDHSWYIGFAPADHPKIAFAVMVEYGGSGGGAAASVAREAIEACIARGYLHEPQPGSSPVRPAQAGE
ncbi:MAG TPA: penicillin-binding transpeptidase domain-containing protein [Tepidisphaeraceae bacterium]|jgi:penicillin-binding protein 2|nr:penicillin-binding transpeptidase domain-containing protein [Tepidisphaeraceae bacterium]